MSGLQSFVNRGRAGSPHNAQNGQPGLNSKRQAVGANAKVKKGSIAQQSQLQSAIPSRGLGNAQNTSAVMQQAPQRRQSGQGQGQKLDPYDTDAESLDTTVNHSIIQVEDSQKRDQQHHQQRQVVDLGDLSDDDEEEFEDEEDEIDDYDFTQEEVEILEHEGLLHISREEQIAFLQQTRPQGFHTVDGDSYPTTTDGNPTEWEGAQEPPSEDQVDGGPPSPSPQRQPTYAQLARPFPPQLHQREPMPNMFGTNQGIQKSSNLFQQSASLRGQQRSTTHLAQPGGSAQQNTVTALPVTQTPSYSQASRDIAPALLLHPHNHQSTQGQINRPSQHPQRQPSGPPRVQLQPPKPHGPPVPSKRPPSAHVKVEPVIQQQQSVEQAPVEELNVAPDSDYDHKTLFAMKYDALKNESFDTNPLAGSPVLTDDMLHKPLIERLEYVQKNFDAGRQSDFFRSLPTTEWEDAGDWFLDQFQGIIQRTRAARQSKRKLAQQFEDEVEKRHKHVSKKQHQVEEAMNKMKMQGEGLVPKSPRASKSPRPKRG